MPVRRCGSAVVRVQTTADVALTSPTRVPLARNTAPGGSPAVCAVSAPAAKNNAGKNEINRRPRLRRRR